MSGPRIARIAVFAALVGVFGLTPAISVPGISVPITAQTLAVMLAGLMLVPLEAFLSVALFVGLVAAGLPLLPGGRGGLAPFTSPTAGFLIGFPIAAAAVAALALPIRRVVEPRRPGTDHHRDRRLHARRHRRRVAIRSALIGGIPWEPARGCLTFIPGDIVKAVAASVVAAAVFRAAPFLAPRLAREGAGT